MTSSFGGYPARYSSTRIEQLADTASVIDPSDTQKLTYDASTAKWTNTADFAITTITTDTTAGPRTYTAAEFLGGIIARDCAGLARADVGPSAADLVAAIPGVVLGSSFRLVVVNTSDAAETITLGAGTDGTTTGVMTIAQDQSKEFLVVISGVTSPGYTIFATGN